MSEQTTPEPTMEEILASIRRIISEDDAPGATARAQPADAGWEPAEIDEPVPPAFVADAAGPDESAAEPEAHGFGTRRSETHGDLEAYVAPEATIIAPAPSPIPEPEPELVAGLEPQPEAKPEPAAVTTSPAPLEDIAPMPRPAPPPREPGLVDAPAAARAASAFDSLAAAALAAAVSSTRPGSRGGGAGRG